MRTLSHFRRGSRRQFLRSSLAGVAVAWVPDRVFGSEKQALDQLSGTAARFHEFVTTRMQDGDGLCRSWLCAETGEPWTNEQLADVDLSFFFQNAPDKAGCLAYENALMSTGEFAASQIARFRATGDESARAAAQRCVQAILAVAEQGRHYMPGYLPKPFGGVARARDSHEISPDQYTKAIVALHEWRPLASRGQRAAIDRFFVDAADFFVARKFRHAYRHRTIVTAQTHPHALGLFVPIVVLASNITAKAAYRQHLPQFDDAIQAAMENEELANFNMTSLIIEGFEVAIREGCPDPRLPKLIRILWERAARQIDAQGDGYEGLREPKRTAQSARLAAAACIVARHHPAAQAPRLAMKILGRLTDLGQMRHYMPADAPKLPASHRWLAYSIDDTALCSWLLAYWRLREHVAA